MIYALIVARNEEHRYLEIALKRLSEQVDRIIFTDDCSTDNTVNIASKYCTVYSTKENLFIKNEAQLRTEAWQNLSNHAKPGDWVVAIDADEILYCLNNESLRDILKMSPYDVVCVKRVELWNSESIRVDKLWGIQMTQRIFRYAPDGVYEDKALACGSEPTYVKKWFQKKNYWLHNDIRMVHLGYVRDEDKKEKYERYMELDNGKYHNKDHLVSIMDQNPVLLPIKSLGINIEELNIK